MLKKTIQAVCVLSCFSAMSAYAVDKDAVLGGAVGGGLGAAIGSEVGGKDGAVAGSAIGAAVGTAMMADDHDRHDDRVYVDTHTEEHEDARMPGPPPHAYRTPPGHVKNGKGRGWR